MILRKNNYWLIIVLAGLVMSCDVLKPKGKSGASKGYYEDLSAYRPNSKDIINSELDGESPSSAGTSTGTTEVSDGGNDTTGSEVSGVTGDITSSLDAKMDSIAVLSKEIKRVDGYSIQVYTGTNERRAIMAKGKVADLMPEAQINYNFEALNFKVRVGKYFDRLEAQRDYATLKKSFPNAIIVMRKFTIKR